MKLEPILGREHSIHEASKQTHLTSNSCLKKI